MHRFEHRVLTSLVLILLTCGCANRQEMKQLQQPKFLLHMQDGCQFMEISYIGREGRVRVLTNSTDFCFKPEGEIQADAQFKFLEITPPNAADLIIKNGWLYVVGSNVSAGTPSHTIAAAGSKLIVDTTGFVDANSSIERPRLMHLDDKVPATVKPATAWRVAPGQVGNDVDEAKLRDGNNNGVGNQKPINANDALVTVIQNATVACGWPAADQPNPPGP